MRKNIVKKITNEGGNLWVTIHENDFFYILGVARDMLQKDIETITCARNYGSRRRTEKDDKLLDAFQAQINRIDQAIELVDSYEEFNLVE